MTIGQAFALSAASACLTPGRADCGEAPAPLGMTYVAWDKAGFAGAKEHLGRLHDVGFRLVTLVANYAYTDLDAIDFAAAPDWDDYGRAVELALSSGMSVVLMPHLEPDFAFDPAVSENHSWRAAAPWRGFFDINPDCADYRERVVGKTLEMLHQVFLRLDAKKIAGAPATVRLDLGAELMNSIVAHPDGWVSLLKYSRAQLTAAKLTGRVLLSHDFSHHFEIPNDVVLRMSPAGRKDLATYIRGLDGIALSQYMDLTIAVPAAERLSRQPTPAEIAQALLEHERHFKKVVLTEILGLSPKEIPPLYLDEFAVCCGGLRFPNVYQCKMTPERQAAWEKEMLLGHQGLIEYLKLATGRTAQSAVLWQGGGDEDLFFHTRAMPAFEKVERVIASYLMPATAR